ncbi:methyltransferase [uncultured Ruegeria sp.]|uniref:tRNA1(Val) (adenine(37)-N6)-methyltransferase n=1 Tax=uncultured Ruegeria sp. TaxID=259304 RepID=UPI0026256E4B|nr:methyltransferase [uncultured Ruegeria sp.]
MTRFKDSDLTCNAFLGGQVQLLQPLSGYRAGVDPVLLAASVPAQPGQSVLELGCGAGAAILCLAARIPELQLAGVEVQSPYADLARRNADQNRVQLDVVEADLNLLPVSLRSRMFDHVIANPPYYRPDAHSPASDTGRSIALGEKTPLADWVAVAAKRLTPKGYLHMVQKAERLPDILSACANRLGSVEVLPLCARIGRDAELVIVRARKGGGAAFRLHAPLILHAGDRHTKDGDSYTPEVSAILRAGAALSRFSVQ